MLRRMLFATARRSTHQPDCARRRLLRYAALGLLSFSDELAATGKRKPRRMRVQIDAGSAVETLAEFVRQTGLQVLFDTDAVTGCTTRAVRGQLDAAEALRLMLDGTGLSFEFINDRTISVHAAPVVRL